MVSRAISGMSTYVLVVISPETTTRPVLTSVSHATRPVGSSASTASSTPSEIWSAILSGCPSVTDSDVNRYSLSESCWLIFARARSKVVVSLGTAPKPGKSRSRRGFSRPPRRAAGGTGARLRSRGGGPAPAHGALAARDEVDDQRHARHAQARA